MRGPLNVARPPQGHPVLFQAGSSEPGKELAARTAEGVFTRALFAAAGAGVLQRPEGPHDEVRPFARPSQGHARAQSDCWAHRGGGEGKVRLPAVPDPSRCRHRAADQCGRRLRPAAFPLDGPLPEVVDATYKKGSTTAFGNVLRWAREEKLTIRQLYQRFAGARGQRSLIGSAAQIVDEMEEWFLNHACDGFLVQPSHVPGGFDDFVALVSPSCRSAASSAPNMKGRPCAISSACRGPRAGTRRSDVRPDGAQPASCHSLNLAVTLARFAAHQASSLTNTLSLSLGLVGRISRISVGTSLRASVFGTA